MRIDIDLLDRCGLGELQRAAANLVLKDFEELLQVRIGLRLLKISNERQLDDFERRIDFSDEAAAEWLLRNLPDYDLIAREEFDRTEDDLRGIVKGFTEMMSDAGH